MEFGNLQFSLPGIQEQGLRIKDAWTQVNAGRTNSMPVPPHSEQSCPSRLATHTCEHAAHDGIGAVDGTWMLRYLYLVPRFVAFTCFKPASEGGHLQLFDNGKIAEELPLLVQKLKQHEVLYQRLLGDNSTDKWHYATGHWQSKYETFDFESAQRKAAEDDILGGQAGSTLERYLEDTVRMEWTIPAVTTIDSKDYMLHAILDNQKKFNENSGLPPFHSMFGNREEFSDTELDALRSATQSSLSHEVLMSPGDVIVLDNWKWAHGRRPYVGHRVHGSVISDRRPRSTTPKGREEL
ncbi:unnamed protein product [Symbiodinium pilosum]|uniref:TauD/TfdA-like domain-containing protein n=1 Tax=Symbiodinium pilosum TaxID=2952 RepID=A0A812US86_SYMPI|nr:unnamed protein product [Symbiodinium pilosum]